MKKDFGLIFWLHLAIIIICLSSPFWLNWKVIILGAILLQIQYIFIDGCYLTNLELGKGQIFWHHYLSKIFPNLNQQTTKMFIWYIIPVLVITISLTLQVLLGYKVLF